VRQNSLGKVVVATLALSLVGITGCESMGGGNNKGQSSTSGGKVIDRDQQQTVSPDGSAQRSRTQVRQTPSGATVRETQTEQRTVTQPGEAGKPADPTKPDPGQP
jgi:hypothetical protein